jgi:hypothetical protein
MEGVRVGCGKAVFHTFLSTYLAIVRDPSTPHVTLVDKLSSGCIINESCQKYTHNHINQTKAQMSYIQQ